MFLILHSIIDGASISRTNRRQPIHNKSLNEFLVLVTWNNLKLITTVIQRNGVSTNEKSLYNHVITADCTSLAAWRIRRHFVYHKQSRVRFEVYIQHDNNIFYIFVFDVYQCLSYFISVLNPLNGEVFVAITLS